jgi:putative ABC transport system permease protein
MTRLKIFHRLFLRPLLREPMRIALIVFAVGLGVGVVLAIDLAGQAAAGSFTSSVSTLTGGADFEVTAGGGVPDAVVARLAALPIPITVQPRIDDYAVVLPGQQTVPLAGVDLLQGGAGGAGVSGGGIEALRDPHSVWVSSNLGAAAGSTVTLQINDRVAAYLVRGVMAATSRDDPPFIVMDIAAALAALHRPGGVDRVLIDLPRRRAGRLAEWEQAIRQALPVGVELRAEGASQRQNQRMLQAFRWNLRILSYIALIVGAFLIYNTISVSVVRRRAEIGILRALGASRRFVVGAYLAESACFGLAGAALGLALGRLMAVGAVRLIGSTVQSLYVSSTPGAIALGGGEEAWCLLLGTAVALASGWAPAREAVSLAPIEAMARGRSEYEARLHKTRDLVAGGALALVAAALSRLGPVDGKPLFGYLCALLLIGASVLAIPALVAALARMSSEAMKRALGVEAMIASRSLAASLRRTSVLVGALATAIAMMVSVGIMVGSFRQTVSIWLDNQLQADYYLRPAGSASAGRHPTLSPAIADRIARLPGVQSVDRFREYSITYQGMPATLAGGEAAVAGGYGKIRFVGGLERGRVMQGLPAHNACIVSEPFATRYGVGAGSELQLSLAGRPVSLQVLGVYYDYSDQRGIIVVDRGTLLRYLPDPAPSSLAVYLKPGEDLAGALGGIRRACAGSRVAIFTNRSLRREALRVFDRTFAITYALEAVAVIVAVMGIAGALLALVVDRRRELGLLRFLGATRRQVRRLILFEAGMLGLLANLVGLALGVLLSLVLIFVINRQSFGWTIQFHWPVAILIAALTGVYASTVAAGLYPARMGVRLNPIEVIHEE